MKPEWNRKYLTIAVYTAIVLSVGIICTFLFLNFSTIGDFFSKLLRICRPIMFGALIAYILNPLCEFFENKCMNLRKKKGGMSYTAKRILAVAVTFLVFFIFIGLFFWMVLPQLVASIKDLGDKFPQYLRSLEKLADSIAAKGGALAALIESLLTSLNKFIDSSYDILSQLLPKIAAMLQSAASTAFEIFLGIIFAVYFLISKEHIAAQAKKLLRALSGEKFYNGTLRILALTDKTFGRYFTGAILDSLLVGFICFLFMIIMRMPYAPLISVIIAVTNIIPYFGPFIGAAPSAIILFVANPIYAIYFCLMILVLQQIDGNIIVPRIHSASTGLAKVWIIVSITIMSGLFGFIGMFIGVPFFSVIYTLIKEQVEKRLKKKSYAVDTVDYMSEADRAYYAEPEKKEHKFIKKCKEFFSMLLTKIKELFKKKPKKQKTKKEKK